MSATCKTCPFMAITGEPGKPEFTCRREPRRFVACDEAISGGPVCWWPPTNPDDWCGEHPLRQRDRLAAMAMQGVAAGWQLGGEDPAGRIRGLARNAYAIADAMLDEAAKEMK